MNNINLLPKHFKDDIAQAKKNRVSFGYLIKSFVLVIMTLAIGIGAYLYLDVESSDIAKETSEAQEKVDEYGSLENEASLVAERLDTVSKISNNLNYWSGTLEEIQKIMPAGVYLSSVNMDSDGKNRSKITGFASSKDAVASLRNSMEGSSKFEFVDIDNSNLIFSPSLEKEVENFIISFSLTKEALNE